MLRFCKDVASTPPRGRHGRDSAISRHNAVTVGCLEELLVLATKRLRYSKTAAAQSVDISEISLELHTCML